MASLEHVKRVETLGRRLQLNAGQIGGRHAHRAAWSEASSNVHARYSSSSTSRYARVELRSEPASTSAYSSFVRGDVATSGVAAARRVAAPTQARAAAPASPGRPLPPSVRDPLRPLLGPEVDSVRIYRSGARADDSARDARGVPLRATAVALGKNVVVERAASRPQGSSFQALLAHEAAHAVWSQRASVGVARSTAVGRAKEERSADAVAALAMVGRTAPATRAPKSGTSPPPSGKSGRADVATAAGTWTAPLGSGSSQQSTALRPMFGHEHAVEPTQGAASVAPPALNLEALKDAVLRELVQRIKCDAERGG